MIDEFDWVIGDVIIICKKGGGWRNGIFHAETGRMSRNLRVELFDSFEEENEAEYRRRVGMTVEERLTQFAVLQARMWGEDWGDKPIVKVATWERVDW